MTLQSRIERLERKLEPSFPWTPEQGRRAEAVLERVQQRDADVVRAAGTIDWTRLTDDELEEVDRCFSG